MYHRISMIGRVGRDPEIKTVKGGLLLSSFSVAIDIHGKTKDQKVTVWMKITVFDTVADFVREHVKKGDLVLIEGRLSPDPATGLPKIFQKKNGSYSSTYDIVGEKVQLLSSKNRQHNAAEPISQSFPDDIPF